MKNYQQKKYWKIALLIFAVAIGLASLLYTNQLVGNLMDEEKKRVQLWADAYKSVINNTDDEENLTFETEVIKNNELIPVILVDESGNIKSARNLDTARINDERYLKQQLAQMKEEREPIVVEYAGDAKDFIYYKNSHLVTQLRYYPYIQLFVISMFLLVSYMAFSSSRRYEQNRVWVGMSKETAHQIGTPLSSLMAWVEYLRERPEALNNSILDEIEKDVLRLETVAERFSKVGSVPKLDPENVYTLISELINYLEKRISKKISLKIDEEADREATAMVGRSLFEWVIENLAKNAVDAMNGKGSIIFSIKQKDKYVYIDIKDTGKGIQSSKFDTVFNPGYTTRTRGWGLGLSLAKRIVEDYHKGSIFVKESEIAKGTTFRIKLKKAVSQQRKG